MKDLSILGKHVFFPICLLHYFSYVFLLTLIFYVFPCTGNHRLNCRDTWRQGRARAKSKDGHNLRQAAAGTGRGEP